MAYFINNPINTTVSVSLRAGVTFHRVIATVSVGGREFEQSYPINDQQTMAYFDISSSLRAYAEGLADDGAAISSKPGLAMPFSVKFREEFMKDGVLQHPDLAATFSGTAILGGYTEMERLRGASATSAEAASYTMRPSSKMLVPVGKDYLCYTRSGAERTARMRSTIPASQLGSYHVGNIYDVPDNGRWTAFQFINTRGLHETAFAQCYSSEQIKGGTQTHVRALRETFGAMSHRLGIPDPYNAVLSFSSGFVDLPWAKWWAYEFCKSKHHWMLVDGIWVRCKVEIKDGASIISRSKTELLSVEFDVVPDIDGMI